MVIYTMDMIQRQRSACFTILPFKDMIKKYPIIMYLAVRFNLLKSIKQIKVVLSITNVKFFFVSVFLRFVIL